MIIKSVQEYLSLIETLNNNYTVNPSTVPYPVFGQQPQMPHFIFRGHSNHNDYLLLPGVFRWRNITPSHSVTEYSQMEHNILNDFISEACRFVKDIPEAAISSWLEIAQHYGVPTRLLDFTENPLVALYFACVGSPKADASVWIINVPTYNGKFYFESDNVQAYKSQSIVDQIVTQEIVLQDYQQHSGNNQFIQWPWIYKPHYHAERMNMQSSIFMIWGARRQPLTAFFNSSEYMVETKPENPESGVICYIDIPADNKTALLGQLDLMGINDKFLYPGIDGVGRYIRKKYSSKGMCGF